jgi:hypothetical protein
MNTELPAYTAFAGHRRLQSGELAEVAVAVRHAQDGAPDTPVLVFCNATGAQVDLDLRGSDDDIRQRCASVATPPQDVPPAVDATLAPPRGRGRPRLGVVAREVTLLPDHWDWLAEQPGGASVTLRKLVHQARRAAEGATHERRTKERAYAFMSAIAGNLPRFEDAARSLFAGDGPKLVSATSDWPEDVREHLLRLAWPGGADAKPPRA